MRVALLVALALAVSGVPASESESDSSSGVPRRDEWQYLTSHFNHDGFAESKPANDKGFDEVGNSFSADQLPEGSRLVVRSRRFGEVQFVRPSTKGDDANMVACEGQEIRIRTKRVFNVLFSLGSAHHGNPFGEIEFRFADGTTAKGAFGFSDWYFEPLYGEETAFRVSNIGASSSPPDGGPRIWLQRTPIPVAKRIVSIRLPNLPNAKIMGLTLGWREGVRAMRAEPLSEPGPGPVAIFSETCFPALGVRGDLEPERIRDAFVKAGISAALLRLEHLQDPDVLNPERYPVLVQPYGSAFPVDAEQNLRAYRQAGGCMVHFGTPFSRAIARSPYGNWIEQTSSGGEASHEGDRAMGTGGATSAVGEIVAQRALGAWGLGDVRWDTLAVTGAAPPHWGVETQVLRGDSLHPEDVVTPLLVLQGAVASPFAAVIRHSACSFAGCVDVWLGQAGAGHEPSEVPLALAAELVVRGTASLLREKGRIDEETWTRVRQPVAAGRRALDGIEPVVPETDPDWRVVSPLRAGTRVLSVRVDRLDERERVMLASAQGLVNRRRGDVAVCLVEKDVEERALRQYSTDGVIEEVAAATAEQVLELVGHRRTVLVDPDMRGSLNLAVMVSAAGELLVGYDDLVDEYRLEVIGDLRGQFSSQAEGYAWAFEYLWPMLDQRALAFIAPDESMYPLIDFLVSRRVFTFWVSWGRDASLVGALREAEIALAARILARTPVSIPVFTAPSGTAGLASTELISWFGKYRVAVDGLEDLSFQTGLRAATEESESSAAEAAEPSPRELPVLEEDKVYVACVAPGPSHVDRALIEAGVSRGSTGTGEAPAEAEEAGRAHAGVLLPAAAFDLLPLQAEGVRGFVGVRGDFGSWGLGDVFPDLIGGAFGDGGDEVRRRYWETVNRSMKEIGQEFLVLSPRRTVGGDEIAASGISAIARSVSAAAVVLPAFQPGAGLDGIDSSYLVDGRPVVHSLAGNLAALRPDAIANGPFSGVRPIFSWVSVSDAQLSRAIAAGLAPEVVIVSPVELASLARQYHARVTRRKLPLVRAGATWRYHDKGEDLGEGWRALGFDDSGWAAGPAELGYGDRGAEKTLLSFGEDESSKHPCTYFRHSFEVADVGAFRQVFLRVLRDDGCVVYLNGREVARSNLPEGEIGFATMATSAIGGSAENTWVPFVLESRLLRRGTNVVAVEMHQSSGTSSDLSFDLELNGYEETRSAPQAVESPDSE